MKYYTIGEVFRQGLLKNHKGEPYKNKASLSHVVARMNLKTQKTPWGVGKIITQKQIETWNNHWK